jgi:hypothetical protein
MRSKSEIEKTLAHLKSSACTGDPAVNAHWIEVLEWVLGDAEHRATYNEWIRHIDPITDEATTLPPLFADNHTPRELVLKYSLLSALERLR